MYGRPPHMDRWVGGPPVGWGVKGAGSKIARGGEPTHDKERGGGGNTFKSWSRTAAGQQRRHQLSLGVQRRYHHLEGPRVLPDVPPPPVQSPPVARDGLPGGGGERWSPSDGLPGGRGGL